MLRVWPSALLCKQSKQQDWYMQSFSDHNYSNDGNYSNKMQTGVCVTRLARPDSGCTKELLHNVPKKGPKPKTAYLETTEFQNIKASCESTHSLLEGWVANTYVPELLLTRISVHIGKVFLHGLETGCDTSAVVRVGFLQLHQLGSDLLCHCRQCMQLQTMYASAESVTTPNTLSDCSFRAVSSARELLFIHVAWCVARSECAMASAATKHRDSIFNHSRQSVRDLHSCMVPSQMLHTFPCDILASCTESVWRQAGAYQRLA